VALTQSLAVNRPQGPSKAVKRRQGRSSVVNWV
jgi:hypothetical protein